MVSFQASLNALYYSHFIFFHAWAFPTMGSGSRNVSTDFKPAKNLLNIILRHCHKSANFRVFATSWDFSSYKLVLRGPGTLMKLYDVLIVLFRLEAYRVQLLQSWALVVILTFYLLKMLFLHAILRICEFNWGQIITYFNIHGQEIS